VALFQLSGGSTGTPKLIPRSHDDYLCSVRGSVDACGWSAATRYLASLPAAHNFPLSSPGVLGALDAGGTAILCESATPDEAFAWIERERVTWAAVVPPLLRVWLEAQRRAPRQVSSLEVLQVGGAPLPESLARQVSTGLGCRLQQVFGMAEGLVCTTRLDDPEALVLGTQGRPLCAADEILVVDDSDRPLPDGEVGHLLTRGPYTIVGYYRDEARHADHFTPQGFYRTGDRVRRLPSGHLVVVGRHKDQINRGGEKIAAPEVEAQLAAHPAVAEVALVPLSDRYLGERSCAVVVAVGEPPRPAELRAFLRDRGLADYKLPDRFEFVHRLPRTAVGKMDKRALQERFSPKIAPLKRSPEVDSIGRKGAVS
jgi:2,3-dihydroxybenzoate-AMP ligase